MFHLDALQDLIHEQDARILEAALLLLHPLSNLWKHIFNINEIVINNDLNGESVSPPHLTVPIY